MPARTTTISRSDSRRRSLIAVATFLLVSVLVIRTSDAAFTADHTNPDNEFATATIDLSSPTTEPLFGDGLTSVVDSSNLFPGDVVDTCIDIVYAGGLDAADLTSVGFDIAGAAGTLADELLVTVDVLDGDCSSGASDNVIVAGSAISGVGATDSAWTPADDGDVRGFAISVEVTDDAAQDDTLADVELIWTLESAS